MLTGNSVNHRKAASLAFDIFVITETILAVAQQTIADRLQPIVLGSNPDGL